jgi:hypothetical protein
VTLGEIAADMREGPLALALALALAVGAGLQVMASTPSDACRRSFAGNSVR